MARVLIERETIYAEEVDLLMEGKSYSEVMKYMDEVDDKRSENRFKKFENDTAESAEGEEIDGKNDGGDDGEKNIRF